MVKTTAIFILSGIAYSLAQPLFAAGITDCDRLAAHKSDPDKVIAAGVSSKDISAAAITACQDAVVGEPNNLRFRYQLARALAENGRAAEGHPDMHMAADGGYRQAQFVLGYLYDMGMQGLTEDPCITASLWRSAARQGLLAALLSFPHHVLRERFDACGIAADNDQLRSMLQQAQTLDIDYYQRMIVTDLLAELAP
jgi:hypothetical protein